MALLAFSACSIVKRQEFRKESETNKLMVDLDNNASLKMLVMATLISILLIFLSFFGFCGAFGDKICLVSYYLVFASLNLALVIVGGIIVLRFSKIPQDLLSEHMADYNNNQTSKDLVDKIRATLGCCLVHRMNNLEELKYATENQIVTASCCDSHQQEKCRQFLRDQSFQLMRWEDLNGIVVTEGCIPQIADMSERVSGFTLPFFILIGCLDLSAILLSTALCCRI
ncbi:putative Tetraspanin-33/sw [Daphnia magna]|uniref:Putative Tetraspanin-33/sw n=2 Tax=Daphnia magna TaxID=35525 RepID=A0A164LK09_9CRUS|nr:putative Tetraspanin-33/sw [Daphnia magna]